MKRLDPLILSSDSNDISRFEEIINNTLNALTDECSNKSAFSGVNPYELRNAIGNLECLPEKGKGFDETLKIVRTSIMPHLLRTWSRDYMPHLHAPALVETIASELIIATYNDSMDSWDQGPAATELEEAVVHELLNLFGYSKGSDGTFTSGGSQSNISAITCARDWYCNEVLHHDIKWNGLPACYSKFRLYTSEVSHFSMDKACHFIGLGYNAVRKIPVDSRCCINLNEFEKMLKEDTESGFIPFCAVATIGTTDYGSIDDVEGMRKLCDKYRMYLHADAAYGSCAIMSPKYKDRLGKLNLADSITVDFHKMFLLPISCSALLVRDAGRLKCFELHADYLNREEDEEEGYINLVGKSMQTTRRFDSLKVFMAFSTRGRDGFAEIAEKSMDNALYFFDSISKDPAFIAPVKPQLSSVVFARNDGDEANKIIRKKLLNDGIVIGQTSKDGKVMLKFTLLNPSIEHSDIDSLIDKIKSI